VTAISGPLAWLAVRIQPVANSREIVIGAMPALNACTPRQFCRAWLQRAAAYASVVDGNIMPSSVTAAPARPAA
jgi:hypothetical protein